MAKEQISAVEPVSYEVGLKLRDLEESHRLMKERVLLIGQNLIDSQEKNNREITSLKKEVYELKTDIKRIKEIIQSMSEEIEKSARREELAILSRQFKMFEPLRYARIEDVEKIVEEKLNKSQHHIKETLPSKHEFWNGKL
ncbi:MAG: hypothetical protein WC781_02965 [Candidatus Pacearchaeota archaeon]|jgi:hypothetical protein